MVQDYKKKIGIAEEKAKTAEINMEEVKLAPNGSGGDDPNAVANQSRGDQEVQFGKQEIDMNEVLRNQNIRD